MPCCRTGDLEGHFDTDRAGALVVLRRVEPATRARWQPWSPARTYRVEPEQVFIPVKTARRDGRPARGHALPARPIGPVPAGGVQSRLDRDRRLPATRTHDVSGPRLTTSSAAVLPSSCRCARAAGPRRARTTSRYGCAPGVVEAGVSSALGDLDGVLDHLLQQAYVDGDRVVMAGQSRGGYLSVVYARARPSSGPAARGGQFRRRLVGPALRRPQLSRLCRRGSTLAAPDAVALRGGRFYYSDSAIRGLLRGVREGGRQRATCRSSAVCRETATGWWISCRCGSPTPTAFSSRSASDPSPPASGVRTPPRHRFLTTPTPGLAALVFPLRARASPALPRGGIGGVFR